MLLCLLPTHSLIAKLDLVTERPLYLAAVGPTLLLGRAATILSRRWARSSALGIALLLGISGAWCVHRVSLWRAPELLWCDAARKAPGKARTWNNLGAALFRLKRDPEAAAAWREATRLDPTDATAARNLEVLPPGKRGSGCSGRRSPRTGPLSTTGCVSWGKLMYSKASLLCNASYADGSLDQETFYGYDFAGRLIEEYIRDDSGRVASHRYSWDKNGNLTQVTLPSSAVLGTTYGSGASNSDSDLPTALWRTSPATPIIDHIAWNPGGVLKQYNRFDTIAGIPLRMSLEYNLAYRPTLVKLDSQIGGGPYYYLKLAEDAKGRVIRRDYYPSDPQIPGIFDSYFIYDQEDRLLCETTNYVTSCPTSGSNIKNSMPAGYTGAGDRTTLLRPIAGSSGGLSHVFNLAPLSHRVASVDQTDGVPALGTTTYGYNALGHRTADDNTNSQTHFDARTFTYDARGSETIELSGTAPGSPGADFSGLMNLGHRGERATFDRAERGGGFRGGAPQRSRTPRRSSNASERPARQASDREGRRSTQQPEDWWGKCWDDIHEGMRPEYAGRVLEWTAQSPVGAAGGGALDKGGSGLFRLGVAARRLPGEGGVDYSGYDWDHRERFCQLLRKTLANSTAGGR